MSLPWRGELDRKRWWDSNSPAMRSDRGIPCHGLCTAKTEAGWWKRSVVECSYWRRIHKTPVLWEPRMVVFLKAAGHTINRKRVQRLMRHMGLAGWHPGRIPAVRTRRTMFILTCCEVFPWSDPIRYGALTSPTSVWHMALHTLWQSWTGIHVEYSAGG